ncbi:hypothetical protein [Paenibacillus sambharensis]|uniref:hypothetical protein n=1 Tax=Paenibacillus sambharensis TaxID=1803190 RepID=UPI0015E8AB8A|nr:hypothetical protein [Paenibacillus sambharensis]
MNKVMTWCLTALALLLLAACTQSSNLNIPEANSFFEKISENYGDIANGQIQQFDNVYITVHYTLSSDDFSVQEREEVFEQTRNFFESENIKEQIVNKIGSEYDKSMLNEGFTIRFQKPQSKTYWVYFQDSGEWTLTEYKPE